MISFVISISLSRTIAMSLKASILQLRTNKSLLSKRVGEEVSKMKWIRKLKFEIGYSVESILYYLMDHEIATTIVVSILASF